MKYKDIKEGVGRITKQNQTVDVGPNEISIQAAKFGNSVDKDGRPPTLSKKVKGKSTNVLFNLGLAEGNRQRNLIDFVNFCKDQLSLKSSPPIKFVSDTEDTTFGYFDYDTKGIVIQNTGRHQMDVMRTVAHELVHYKQDQAYDKELNGEDGSPDENQANALAGVILRRWGQKNPTLFTESVDNLYESVLYYRHMKETLGEIAQATEIYVDMDGVLADFFGEWAKLMKVDHFSKIDKEHKIGDALQAIRDTDEFWLNLPMLPQAKQLLSVIKQIKGEYNICSSPLADDPNSEPHKREWIKKNLAFFPPKEVIITSNKPEYATQSDGTPNILIDDFGKNVSEWEAAGGTAFKYKDHKFERTANAIKQHMQEPVAEDKETNKKTRDAATTKAKPYAMPIRRDIADLIMQSYPEIKDIWITSDQYGIVGTKLKNGPVVLKLQRQLKKDGYPIKVDGNAGNKTDKMFTHWLGNVIYYIKHDYLGESVTKNFANGKNKVQEAFDTQIDWEEDSDMFSSDGEAYKANIGYKEVGIQYYFEVVDAGGFPLSGVDVTFEVNGTTKKTGGGDASTIFGAVVNHIKQFISQHSEIDAIEFSASKEQGLSRTRLYSAMVDKLSQGTDWINAKTISKADKSVENADTFKLVRRSAVNDKMTGIDENFADGKKKGKSRPGRVKRSGASCNGSVTELRAKAKKASGERAKMYHWCANMKSGRK